MPFSKVEGVLYIGRKGQIWVILLGFYSLSHCYRQFYFFSETSNFFLRMTATERNFLAFCTGTIGTGLIDCSI